MDHEGGLMINRGRWVTRGWSPARQFLDRSFSEVSDLMPQLEEGLPVGSAEVMNRLQISIEHQSDVVIVRLTGEVDVATAPELDQRLQEIATGGHTHVVIDLSEVEFIDSTGLQSIVRAQYFADANRRRLTLRRGSPQVQRLFEITGLLDRVSFEDSET
jgi:anti-sigma B factor antagonist